MKGLKIFAGIALAASTLTSCIGDGNGQNGFAFYTGLPTVYANTPSGSVTFLSYGNWALTLSDGSSWLTPSATSGKAMYLNTLKFTFATNTSHSMRSATISLQDKDEIDANAQFVLSQYGTRGDGSWGDAPQVKKIVATDESGAEVGTVELAYDANSRPTSLTMTGMADGAQTTLHTLTFAWTDSVVTVGGDASFTTAYLAGFQMPASVEATGDTLRFLEANNGNKATSSYLCQLGEAKTGGEWTIYKPLYTGQLGSFYGLSTTAWPDLERKADTLTYEHHKGSDVLMSEKLGVTYSAVDNRCQTVDANQLLFGLDECNPYLLLGLYRNLRSTSVIAEATDAAGKYAVATTLNADKSVATMTVTDKKGGKVTYTFSY